MAIKSIAAVMASAVIAGASLVMTTMPASAGTCLGAARYTAVVVSTSTSWATTGTSSCADLNAAYTYKYNDRVTGYYYVKSSGSWKAGSRGSVAVTTSNSGWKVLLSDIQYGITVRGKTSYFNQYVQYVW